MRSALVVRDGALICINLADGNPLPADVAGVIESQLTYTYVPFRPITKRDRLMGQPSFQGPQRRRMYDYDRDGRLVCPKGFFPRIHRILHERRVDVQVYNANPPKPEKTYFMDWESVVRKHRFRPYQEECLCRIARHTEGLIDAATAFGKMYVIAMVCDLFPHARIDVITKATAVANSIYSLLLTFRGDIGRVGGGKNARDRVTVLNSDSLHLCDFDADILLLDEVHQLVTDKPIKFLAKYGDTRAYGFTATSETRMDNAHNEIEGVTGPTIFRLEYQEAQTAGLVAPIVVQWLDVHMTGNPCEGQSDMTTRKRLGIWRNDTRNRKIAAAASSFAADGLQTLITVETMDHALHLKKELPEFELCYAENWTPPHGTARYYSELGVLPAQPMTSYERERLKRGFYSREIMGVIATPVWSTGVSFDSLNVIIRAEGQSSETQNVQTPGRVSRVDPASGKQCGVIVDCMDLFDERFCGASKSRRLSYDSRGWTQYTSDGSLWLPRVRLNTTRKRRRIA